MILAAITICLLLFTIIFSGCERVDQTSPPGTLHDLVSVKGIINGDFEVGEAPEESGWSWWSRDDVGSVTFSTRYCREGRLLKIVREGSPDSGYFDWTLTNEGRLDVNPGEVWTASAWVKYKNTDRIALDMQELGSDGNTLIHHPPGGGGGTHEKYGTGDWTLLQATSIVPPDGKQLRVRLSGLGATTAWVDKVRIHRGPAERTRPPKSKVEGWAFDGERIREELGRGLVAMPREQGDIYVRWRLLEEDPDDVAFNVYRVKNGGDPVKLNSEPVKKRTDFADSTADPAAENQYFVRTVIAGQELKESRGFTVDADMGVRPYKSISLKTEETTFQKVGIGDLNGDGQYDFVIKTPDTNVDPYVRYWRPSDITYTLQAYLSDGTFLWEKDLGWNIEAGIWYSPFIVYDFNGDGRAEVAVKTAPADVDYRDKEPSEGRYEYDAGRVRKGPEYLSILDGMTGEVITQTDWPTRDGLGAYNYYSRNQLGVAYLDGKTPFVLAARGTYGLMKLEAYEFQDGELDQVWSWESADESGGFYYGQGAHHLLTVDLDGDGRDEIILGSAVIDDNGDGLWSTGMGHPDNMFVGNLDPTRPGLEIFYGLETDQPRYGITMVDAGTGTILWGLNEPTVHIHGSGLVSNIDTTYAGMENYGGDSSTGQRWLHTARGKLLARDEQVPWSTLSPGAVYWDGSTQRELIIGERIFRYPDNETIFKGVEGRAAAWVDLFGDWREEIITSVPGELRIYMTDKSAQDRRVTLMQDHLYRTSVTHMAMGYGDNPPLTSYYIE